VTRSFLSSGNSGTWYALPGSTCSLCGGTGCDDRQHTNQPLALARGWQLLASVQTRPRDWRDQAECAPAHWRPPSVLPHPVPAPGLHKDVRERKCGLLNVCRLQGQGKAIGKRSCLGDRQRLGQPDQTQGADSSSSESDVETEVRPAQGAATTASAAMKPAKTAGHGDASGTQCHKHVRPAKTRVDDGEKHFDNAGNNCRHWWKQQLDNNGKHFDNGANNC
jgi:hypothetical protein